MTPATLVLLCKRPALGYGKQRLAVKVGAEIALQIAEALLACALEDSLAWPGTLIVAPAESKDREWAASLFKQKQADLKVLPQISGNLGQRMNALDHTLRTSGFNQLIYIGSDSPDIKMADIIAASEALSSFDTILKPTIDGGVSIMANRKPWPDLSHLPWSSSQFRHNLTMLCEQSKYSTFSLAQGFDVDELEDLAYLVTQLEHDERPARRKLWLLARKVIQINTCKQTK